MNKTTQDVSDILIDESVEDIEKEEGDFRPKKPAGPKRMMDDLIKSSPNPPEIGAIVEGTVIAKAKK
ncbi:MAG: hypothetical protein NTV48_02055, partial [Candidatus Vogelbacteria bacterium]|nr:hypothetical protein [Candidatus Vogelbacteria bacterium]